MTIFLQAEMHVNPANYIEEKYSSLWDLWVFYTLCSSVYLKIKAVYCFCIQKKQTVAQMGDPGLIPGLGRSPEEGNGYPLQYSCLEKWVIFKLIKKMYESIK